MMTIVVDHQHAAHRAALLLSPSGCNGLADKLWPLKAALGAACAEDWECASGRCVPAELGGEPTGWTGGMCLAACPGGACEQGAQCTTLAGERLCLPTCEGWCETWRISLG